MILTRFNEGDSNAIFWCTIDADCTTKVAARPTNVGINDPPIGPKAAYKLILEHRRKRVNFVRILKELKYALGGKALLNIPLICMISLSRLCALSLLVTLWSYMPTSFMDTEPGLLYSTFPLAMWRDCLLLWRTTTAWDGMSTSELRMKRLKGRFGRTRFWRSFWTSTSLSGTETTSPCVDGFHISRPSRGPRMALCCWSHGA